MPEVEQRRERLPELADARAVYDVLRQDLRAIVQPCEQPLAIDPACKPFVIMAVGVNGTGKTTSVAKLANRLKQDGHQVMLAAADTFRAAAVEQLKTWGERAGVPVIAQQTGADAAAVAFDALQAAKARGADILIVDTAGRQHTHAGLMDELKKIRRVLGKLDDAAPHEVLLVLDAGTGQNALSQLSHFRAAVGVTGLVITKLDGTAKGGIVIAIAKKTGLPIRYLGVGEALDDLQDFRVSEFVDALLPTEDTRGEGKGRGKKDENVFLAPRTLYLAPMIRFSHVFKRYPGGYDALKNISFELNQGEMAFLTGHSGAGKSSLLRLIALIERPTRGDAVVNGHNLNKLPRRRLPYFRRDLGVVFQDYKLLYDRTVFDNVALPLVVSGTASAEIGKRVRAALDKVGLLDKERVYPITLSGGEQQRVGIARAVVSKPSLLLADEPTGNLDAELSDGIMDLFLDFHHHGVTVLIATHDQRSIARLNKRVLSLSHGELAHDSLAATGRTTLL